ncbi:MAG: SDR family oxidoreductase [Nodularia sp. CChRGM 3473]
MNNNSEIAIIGMSCRFPGANNIDEFWQNLRDGVESISFFDEPELLTSGIDATLLNHPNYVKANGVISGIDMFDAAFFNFSAREAEMLDPQHRLLLEHAWEAIEQAGYDTESYTGAIGIYAGSEISTYLLHNIYPQLEPQAQFSAILANDKDYLCTRVSYKLNLKGPAVTVQTACSTSLVAIHCACQSLLNGECDMALAGGVSVRTPPKSGYLYQKDMIFSPDGHCRSFDIQAQGTVFGSGVGIVVLKRLADAIADKDCIHAIIKGSAINNDGSLKLGYTAPSIDQQTSVIAEAQSIAAVEPQTITYIEAHGTATELGDPIEIAALTQAFPITNQRQSWCAIGSVKTNIGHLGSAAGVAGLIKTVLALKHQQIPPTLHFVAPNPKIDFLNSPFYVNTQLCQWQPSNTPRRAGVSSLGVGGTNVHIVLEEAPSPMPLPNSPPWQLLVLSAQTPTALATATTNLATHLQQHPQLNLADVAHTLQVGRRAWDYRQITVCQNLKDAIIALSDPQRVIAHLLKPSHHPVVMMFSGQGTQYVNMTRELYQTYPSFTRHIDRCCQILAPHLGIDLRTVLYPNPDQTEVASAQLLQTAIAQPALFVIEYALAQFYIELGVRPIAAIGHSIGEYVAATLAGVFSLEDALAVVAARGQLMQQLPPGSMLAVPLSEFQVQPLLGTTLSLAAINGLSACVVSGATADIEALQNHLVAQGVNCRRLHTSHAFHSGMMQPIVNPFTERVQQIHLRPPQIPYISNVTGTWITEQQATDAHYWAKHLRQTVRFASGLQTLLKESSPILLEVGPGRTLSKLAKQHPDPTFAVFTSVRHPQEDQSDVAFLLNTIGQLWLLGVKLNWSGLYPHESRQRLPLPTYPFERQCYWIEPPQLRQHQPVSASPSQKLDIADWFNMPLWKQSAPPSLLPTRNLLPRPDSCTLVFLDDCGVGSQLVEQLEQAGTNVVVVKIGQVFSPLNIYPTVYTLNPEQPDDYKALLKALLANNQYPQTIVHLWNITSVNSANPILADFDRFQSIGFYSLLFLAQALAKQNCHDECQITVISNTMQLVTGTEYLHPEKATLLSPIKVIPQEYPHISCRSIDIELPNTHQQQAQLIQQLLAELHHPTYDSNIAYRHHQRWVQTFEQVQFETTPATVPVLTTQGVYLIIGGLGNLGFILAQHLAQNFQAKLILTGRSLLPQRHEWSQWLSNHDQDNKINRQIRKVLELEKLGAEVLVFSADIANLSQMQNVISQAEAHFGQINGVIHAAGITQNFAAIGSMQTTDCEQQFIAKIQGLVVLEKLLQQKHLDFCLLMSSLSSVLGGVGLIAYAAANVFMDVFVQWHNQNNSLPWMTVNWDGWDLENPQQPPRKFGLGKTEFLIKPEQGIKAFEYIISRHDINQIIVATGELSARINQWIKPGALRASNTIEKTDAVSLYPRYNPSSNYVAPRNEIEQILINIWQKNLKIQPISIHDSFFELGGDSLIAVQIMAQMRETFQVDLVVSNLFDKPTIEGIAAHIVKIRRAVEQLPTPNHETLNEREEIKF